MDRSDVLIVGAGPTGLVLALWLTKLGVKVRIIDKTAEPGTTSRALAVHARTLELYRQLDLTDAVIAQGYEVPSAQLWVKGAPAAQISFETVGADVTAYPFMHIFPQDRHEHLLVDRLEGLGVTVDRQTELTGFTEDDERISARLRGAQGQEETCEARYIAGCDGARSIVRETIGIGFPGGTYRQIFYVADVEATGPAVNGGLNIDLDEADFLAVFPLTKQGSVRLVGTIRDEQTDRADTLRFEDISDRAIRNLKVTVTKVNWFSTYHVHHRVADHFRKGRAFLLGDAAHIHSPAGGQGMNTGIGDAINLAWKLQTLLDGHGSDALLDAYETERIGFARRLVATTDRAFSFVTGEGRLADILRTRVAPLLVPALARPEFVRDYMFRTISQITLSYRDSPLSQGKAGDVHGGDRLPWVSVDGKDNFAALNAMAWQVHVYGKASEALSRWCAERKLPLHVFDWSPDYEAAGFARDGLYLIRPDTYVAMAESSGSPEPIERYFAEQKL